MGISFQPILPAALTNLELKLESDRQTTFKLSYVNPAKNRNLQITATRNPGKNAKIVVVKDGAVALDLNLEAKDLNLRKVDGNFEVKVTGTSAGTSIDGSVKGEANSKGNRIKIEFEKGNKKFVQIDSKIKKNVAALYFESKTKYSLLGGAIVGTLKLKFDKNQLNIENNIKVDATGSKRNFKIDLNWKATKPDWDLSTPEKLKLSFNWAGKGPRWGTYSIHRDLSAKVANKVIEFKVNGDASFTQGVFSAVSPIKTDIDLKYLIEGRDLIGKASKTLNGKEYSIEFPEGYMVMPKISMGA